MNNLIVNFVFGVLALIFLIGIVIIICNAVKIQNIGDLLSKRIKEQNLIKLAKLKTEIQNKLIPLIPSLPVLTSDPFHQKFIPLLIQSKKTI